MNSTRTLLHNMFVDRKLPEVQLPQQLQNIGEVGVGPIRKWWYE